MIFYYFLLVLAFVLAFCDFGKDYRIKSVLLFIFFIYMSVVAGYRIGVKGDYYNYVDYFYIVTSNDIFTYAYSKEWGYALLNYSVKVLGGSEHEMFFIVALAAFAFTFASYKQYTKYVFVSILVYMSFFLLQREMGAIRAGLAYSIILYSLKFVAGKQYIKFFCFVFIAFAFHLTAFLALIIPIFYRLFSTPKTLAFLLLSGVIFNILSLDLLFFRLLPYSETIILYKINTYISNEYYTQSLGLFDITNIKNFLSSSIAIVFLRKLGRENKYFTILITVYVLGTALRIAFSDYGQLVGRGYTIFNTPEPILLGTFTVLFEKKSKTIYIFVLFIYCILTFYMMSEKYTALPYRNYLLELFK